MAAAGKYDRLDVIGSGTFGRAWLVRRTTTGRRYVLKEMRITGLSENDRRHAATEVPSHEFLSLLSLFTEYPTVDIKTHQTYTHRKKCRKKKHTKTTTLSGQLATYLARSAKVAERAICFTDRNFYLFL